MPSKQLYDVAITGGGLAGLCLAIQCADNGLSVILFEKEQYPFHKVCGEYISLESWNFLQRIGLPLDELNLPLIKTLLLSDGKGKAYSFHLPLGGFGISRFALDNRLYKLAVEKGVQVCTNTKVNSIKFQDDFFAVSTTGETAHAKVATAAYGKRSNLDIKWKRPFTYQKSDKLNNYIGIKYHISYQHDPSQIALHNFYNGYCGISKIEEGKSCLCYLTTAENLKSCGNSIDKMQKEILYQNPQLKEIFTSAKFLYEQPLSISQISFSKKSQVENHVLMLGDAAGTISPLCGNGMSMAMHSSKLAFTAIKSFLAAKIGRKAMEEQYASTWKNEFAARLFIGRTVQKMFGGGASTSLFIKTFHHLPFLARRVIQSTHGQPF